MVAAWHCWWILRLQKSSSGLLQSLVIATTSSAVQYAWGHPLVQFDLIIRHLLKSNLGKANLDDAKIEEATLLSQKNYDAVEIEDCETNLEMLR